MTCRGPGNTQPRVEVTLAGQVVTERQAELLAFILVFRRSKGFAPVVREFKGHFDIHSNSGVHTHLEALKEKRLVKWVPNTARTLRLTRSGAAVAKAYLAAHPEAATLQEATP